MAGKKETGSELPRGGVYSVDSKKRLILPASLREAANLQSLGELSVVVAPTADCFYLGTHGQIQQRLQDIPDLSRHYLSFINRYYAICPIEKDNKRNQIRLTITLLISLGLMQSVDSAKLQIELGQQDPMILLYPVRRKNRKDIEFVLLSRVAEKLKAGDGLTINWDRAKIYG